MAHQKAVINVLICCTVLSTSPVLAQSGTQRNQQSIADVKKKTKALKQRYENIDKALSNIPARIETSRYTDLEKLIQEASKKIEALKKTRESVLQEKKELFGQSFDTTAIFRQRKRNFLLLKKESETEAISLSGQAPYMVLKKWQEEAETYAKAAETAEEAGKYFSILLAESHEALEGLQLIGPMLDRMSIAADEWRLLLKDIKQADSLKERLDRFAEDINEIIDIFDTVAIDTRKVISATSYTSKNTKKSSSSTVPTGNGAKKKLTTAERLRAVRESINRD